MLLSEQKELKKRPSMGEGSGVAPRAPPLAAGDSKPRPRAPWPWATSVASPRWGSTGGCERAEGGSEEPPLSPSSHQLGWM